MPDVEAFPGHIACSSLTKSEIVVPLVHAGTAQLVLDIGSINVDDFDEIDKRYLEQVITL